MNKEVGQFDGDFFYIPDDNSEAVEFFRALEQESLTVFLLMLHPQLELATRAFIYAACFLSVHLRLTHGEV